MKLMTHLYYGDPNEEFSLQLAQTLLESGADILEVGIPYTDPVCDGEVFQKACQRALGNGVTPIKVLEGIKRIREKGYREKIYLTSYYGPIFKIGVKKFVGLAKKAGMAGLIVPDLLLEEQGELRKECERVGLSLIQFATVYSTKERLRQIIKSSSDFIYCLSLPGVTGETILQLDIIRVIQALRKITDRKIMVGFGIRSTEDVRRIIKYGADGVIVGSAIAKIYEGNLGDPDKSLPKISQFIKSLKEGTII